MSSLPVEFRLLQLVLNPIGDERRTIALLHWDGRDMRFAWNRSDLHVIAKHAKDDIGIVLDAIHDGIRGKLQNAQLRMDSGLSLSSAYPVVEGLSGLLTWGPVRMGHTGNPQAHFEELSRLLDLYQPTSKPQRQRREDWIQRQLMALGHKLRNELGDVADGKVLVRHVINGILEAKPPLSWMNGKWHHSFPVNFEHSSIDSIAQKFQFAFGRIDASVPPKAVGVIISVHPDQGDFRSELDRVERFAKEKFGDRLECLRATLAKRGSMWIDDVEHRVRADIASSTAPGS